MGSIAVRSTAYRTHYTAESFCGSSKAHFRFNRTPLPDSDGPILNLEGAWVNSNRRGRHHRIKSTPQRFPALQGVSSAPGALLHAGCSLTLSECPPNCG